MITVPYSLLCVKIETGFFFALLILPKLRRYFAAEQQVRAFLIFAVLDIVQLIVPRGTFFYFSGSGSK